MNTPLVSARIEALFISLGVTLCDDFTRCFPSVPSQQAAKQLWQKSLAEFKDEVLEEAVLETGKVFRPQRDKFGLPYFREICVSLSRRRNGPPEYSVENIVAPTPVSGSLHELINQGADISKMLKTLYTELPWPMMHIKLVQLKKEAHLYHPNADAFQILKFVREEVQAQLNDKQQAATQ